MDSIRVCVLLILTIVLALACLSILAMGEKLIESDDFTGQDGDLPDPDMWECVKTTADDSVRLEADSVRTAVKNGGYAFIRSNRTFSSNNVTMLVEARIGFNYHRPIDVRLMTNHSGTWQRWIAVGYDPHGYGWSAGRWINGEPDGFNSYETTGAEDTWYLLNITVVASKFNITVTERDTGEVRFSIENWTCDPLESENKVYFGVYQNPPGSWQDTICFYDNYSLYDLSQEGNRPPVWGPLPVLEAVEDEPLVYDFSANVSDRDDPLTRLSLSSGSPYVMSISGFDVTLLFPNGVTMANITLVASDGPSHAAATVRVLVTPVNDPPAIELVSPPDGTRVLEGTPIDLTVRVSDPDLAFGDGLTVTLSSDLSGELGRLTGLGELSLVTDGLAVGSHVITARVTDGDLDASETINVTVERFPTPPPNLRTPGFYWLIIAVSVLVMVLGAFYTWMRSRSEER